MNRDQKAAHTILLFPLVFRFVLGLIFFLSYRVFAVPMADCVWSPESPYCVSEVFSSNTTVIAGDKSNGLNNNPTSVNDQLNWVIKKVGTSNEVLPANIADRLKLTSNLDSRYTQDNVAMFMYRIPGYDNTDKFNTITIDFDAYVSNQKSPNGTSADGFTLILSDASEIPNVGPNGTLLSYATSNEYSCGNQVDKNGKGAIAGFAGGWLGLGVDEYDGSSFCYFTGTSATSVAIRGSYTGLGQDGIYYAKDRYYYGYKLIPDAYAQVAKEVLANTNGAHYQLVLTAIDTHNVTATLSLTPYLTEGTHGTPGTVGILGATTTLFKNINLFEDKTGVKNEQRPLPRNLLLSFASSTGSININGNHSIDNIKVQSALPIEKLTGTVDHFEFEFDPIGTTNYPQSFVIKACGDKNCSPTNLIKEQVTVLLTTITGSSYCSLSADRVCGDDPSGTIVNGTLLDDGVTMKNTTITFKNGVAKVGLIHPDASTIHLIGMIKSDPGLIPFQSTFVFKCNNAIWDYDETEKSNCAIKFRNTPNPTYCYSDDFNRSNGSITDNNWVGLTGGSTKPANIPGIYTNRLRLTNTLQNESTTATYLYQIPTIIDGKRNYFEIEFDGYAYGGCGPSCTVGGDGLAMVLSNAVNPKLLPSPGSAGGALGYAAAGGSGFRGGWLGLGLDEYGNYSSALSTVGAPGRKPNSIALRGSGSDDRKSGYNWLAGYEFSSSEVPMHESKLTSPTTTNHYRMTVDATTEGETWVNIKRSLDNGLSYGLNLININVSDPKYKQQEIPKLLYFSFTGGTGSLTNNHEVDNLKICSVLPLVKSDVHHYEFEFEAYGITEQVRPIVIKACLDEACSAVSNTDVTMTLADLPDTGGNDQWVPYVDCGSSDISCPKNDNPVINDEDMTILANNLINITNNTIQFKQGTVLIGLKRDTRTTRLDVPSININEVSPGSKPFGPDYLYKCNASIWKENDTPQNNTNCNLYFGPQPTYCVTDDFNRANGSITDDNWVGLSSGQTKPANIPGVAGNRLRLTDLNYNGYEATTAVLLYQIQTTNETERNYFEVEFDGYTYGGCGTSGCIGGDGMAMVLSNASNPKLLPAPGDNGGALGYAAGNSSKLGFRGGWLGFGLDEYGNYSSKMSSGGNPPGQRKNSVALRGSGSDDRKTGYNWLATYSFGSSEKPMHESSQKTPTITNHYRMTVDMITVGETMVNIRRSTDGGLTYGPSLMNLNVDKSVYSGQKDLPKLLYLSFTGGTGDSKNYHEVDNLKICSVLPFIKSNVHHYEFDFDQDASIVQSQPVTIKACADELCSVLVDDDINMQLDALPATGGNDQWVPYDRCKESDESCQQLANLTTNELIAGHLIAINNDTVQFKQGTVMIALKRNTITTTTDFPTIAIKTVMPGAKPFGPDYLYKCNSNPWKDGDTPQSNTYCNLYFREMPLSCTIDNFNRSNSTSIGSQWFVNPDSTKGLPQILNNRLRLTEDVKGQLAVATYQEYLPTEGGYIEVTFDHLSYKASGTSTASNTADGLALIFADASIPTTQIGTRGGALGYVATTASGSAAIPGFAGGWLGLALDEYGNFSNKLVDNNGSKRPNSVALRGKGLLMAKPVGSNSSKPAYQLDPNYYGGYQLLTNSSVAVTGGNIWTDTMTNKTDRYRVILDTLNRNNVDQCANGKLCVTVLRSANGGISYLPVNNTGVLSDLLIDQTLPGAFTFSFSSGTGDMSTIHEIDNFKMCSLSEPQPINTYLDHFEYDIADNTQNCMDKKVTIIACANSNCSSRLEDTQMRVTLNPIEQAVWLPYNNCNGSDVACLANTANIIHFDEGSRTNGNTPTITFINGIATVGLRNNNNNSENRSVPISYLKSIPSYAPGTTTHTLDVCTKGTLITEGVNNAFYPGGGYCLSNFTDATLAVTSPIPNGMAGMPIDISMIAMKNKDALCIPRFKEVTRTIQFSGIPTTAVTDATKLEVSALDHADETFTTTYNGIEVSDDPAVSTPIDVYFDSNGQAQLQIRYLNAGQLNLQMKYVGTEATQEDTLILEGTSNTFAIRPYGLCVINDIVNQCDTLEPDKCPPYASAGENFPLTMIAKSWTPEIDSIIAEPIRSKVSHIEPSLTDTLTWQEAKLFNTVLCTQAKTIRNIKHNDLTLALSHRLIEPVAGQLSTIYNGMNFIDNADSIPGKMRFDTAINEAGIFEIAIGSGDYEDNTSTLVGTPYQVSTLKIPASVPHVVGTLYPNYFELSDQVVINANNNFSYMDNPNIKIGYTVTAKSLYGQPTMNYSLFPQSQLATFYLGLYDIKRSIELDPLRLSCNDFTCDTFVTDWQSDATVTLDVAHVNFSRIVDLPDGPYTVKPTLTVINPKSSRAIALKSGDNYSTDTVLFDVTETLDLRFGYLKVNPTGTDNQYQGVTGHDLKIDFEAQYYDDASSSFIKNSDDNETQLYLLNSKDLTNEKSTTQCRDGSRPNIPTINNYLMVPDMTQNEQGKITAGKGFLMINAPSQAEDIVTYWFLMGDKNDPTNECISNENGAPTLAQPWLQFDARKDNQKISPSADVSFENSNNSGLDRKIIYRKHN